MIRTYMELASSQASCGDQVKELTSKVVEKDLHIQAALDSTQALKMQLQRKEKELSE